MKIMMTTKDSLILLSMFLVGMVFKKHLRTHVKAVMCVYHFVGLSERINQQIMTYPSTALGFLAAAVSAEACL